MKNKLTLSTLILICIFNASILNSQDLWHPFNGPNGGPVYTIITGNPSYDFCISPSGIFKTSNDGDVWSQSTPASMKNLYVGSAAGNGYIYAATTNYTTLLYRSSDNGVTWQQRLDAGLDFNAVAVSPNGTIFAGTFYMFSFHGQFIQEGDVYRSTDNGDSWTMLNFPPLAVVSLKINSSGHIFVATTEGVFMSANNGASFGLLRSGSTGSVYISSQNHIFIQTTGDNIFRSTDNGGSWINVGSGNEIKMPVSEDADGNLYAGYSGRLYKSTDNGTTWNLYAELSGNSFFEVSSIIFKTGGRILTSTSKGIFRSENNGVNWVQANSGIRDPQVKSVSVKGNTIFTGSINSLSRSNDNGNSWTVLSNGLPDTEARNIEFGSSGFVYANMIGNGLYRTSDNGDTWSHLTGLPVGLSVSHIVAGAQNELFTATSDGRVFKSLNNGNNWMEITNDLPDSLMILGFYLDAQNNLYASIQVNSWFSPLSGIYKSTNEGSSWFELTTEISPEEMKINSNGVFFAKFGNSLLKSVNGGVNFLRITPPEEYVIKFNIGTSDQIIMHSAQDKIYKISKSLNDGQTWSDMTGILSDQLVYDLEFDANANVIAATQSGVYKSDFTTGIVNNNNILPAGFILEQNYPNPFNPVTQIKFNIPQGGEVDITVFDAAGRYVTTLVKENLSPGRYEIQFDGSNFSSGIYYYNIKAGNYTESKKMLLIK